MLKDYSITELYQELKSRNVAVDIWTLDDVKGRLCNYSYKWDRAKGKKVLESMQSKADANIGLSWDILDFHINKAFG